jgi:hypothetical protein
MVLTVHDEPSSRLPEERKTLQTLVLDGLTRTPSAVDSAWGTTGRRALTAVTAAWLRLCLAICDDSFVSADLGTPSSTALQTCKASIVRAQVWKGKPDMWRPFM